MSGASLNAPVALRDVRGPIDTLIVAGGDPRQMLEAWAEDRSLERALRRIAKRARRIASVCTGSFVLAAAGLLDGRSATTHWAACDLLQKAYPKVRVERGPIFTQDGNVFTSAGATSGMDLALALVRHDHGATLARELARWLVLYVERSAQQPQLSVLIRGQPEREPLRELQHWILEHLQADLSVPVLAQRVGMSVRNFARTFKREHAISPADYVESVRVEAALRRLEHGHATLEQIARDVGFGSLDTLRRALRRRTGKPPTVLRKHHETLALDAPDAPDAPARVERRKAGGA